MVIVIVRVVNFCRVGELICAISQHSVLVLCHLHLSALITPIPCHSAAQSGLHLRATEIRFLASG